MGADCQACRGACCESFFVREVDIRMPGPDSRRWLTLHGTERQGGWIEFECRCTKLTPEGRCGIYADRPLTCVVFEPGGEDCRAAVHARRSPEEAEAILG